MDYEEITKEQMDNLLEGEDFSGIYEGAERLSDGFTDGFTLENIWNGMFSGESLFQSEQVIDSFRTLLLYEIKEAMVVGVEILSICVIMGILKSFSDSFSSKSVSQLTMLVCTMVVIGISMRSFHTSYTLALDTVSTMVYTMEILTPVLIGILLATGAVASGSILSPVMAAAVSGFGLLIKNFVLPALFVSTILGLVNCLTEKNYVNKLSKLIRGSAVFLTGLVLTLLSGIISIQGLLTCASDGLLINAAKYSLSTFIPIVGGFTSDTVELFLRCMGVIKSVVGVFGLLMMLLMMLFPLIKVLIIGGIYKAMAAIAEPVTDTKLSDGLNQMGSSLISIGAILFFTSLLFILFITIIMKLGGT